MTDHCQALERLLHHDIQLTRAMQLQVLSWQAHELRLRLPLAANSNHHHSMFGGSLYSAAVLAGWGWLHLLSGNHLRKGTALRFTTVQTQHCIRWQLL